MIEHKIIFTGPVGAGKTTSIQTISDVFHVGTDATATDMTKKQKPSTTVAMDYGVLNLPSGEKIHLYGTPGQERFNFMWDILTKGGVGLVLMINNAAKDPLGDMAFFVKAFKSFIQDTTLVIGVSQLDVKQTPSINDFVTAYKALAEKHRLEFPVPIFEVDAREKDDVALLIEALIYSLDTSLVAQHGYI